MPDAKITALTENTSPVATDLLVMVDDPAGVPLTQKVTVDTMGKAMTSLNLGLIVATARSFNKM